MNLATRCTACGTIFRVVQDQLRVSEGWVRCGRCAEVFDAGEQLFDLERDTPPPWPPQGAAAEPPPPVSARPAPPPPQPPYHPYQGDFQPSQPARMPPAEPPAPVYAPEPPPMAQRPQAPPTFAPSSLREDYDDRPVQHTPRVEPDDNAWLSNDSELNPFAPSRPMDVAAAEEDLLPSPRQFTRPRHRVEPPAAPHHSELEPELDSSYYEDRREPFLEPPAVEEDPRSHLPEPKGMRFEEDELPPPMTDDERPDVLVAFSAATAAQLAPNEPTLSPTPTVDALGAEPSLEGGLAADEAVADEPPAKPAKKAKDKKPKKEPKPAAASAPTVPSFMRKAESAKRWHRPWVRVSLSAVAGVLALGLGGQWLWQGRESLAAQYPFTKPMLGSMATAMGQEIKPWRHIEALSVESSSLNPAGSGNQYRLTLALRNRSAWEVAQPWVDLSLTDASGQLVIRRMISPTEMKVDKASMLAGADQQLQVVFDSGEQKISGYTVELFYP